MLIGVIDYNAGNITSVVRALEFLDVPNVLVKSDEDFNRVDSLIFPGVGQAESAMQSLNNSGHSDLIREFHAARKPILGICLGTQVILQKSEEGPTDCLGLIPGVAKQLPAGEGIKVPHMGWNSVERTCDHPLFDGIRQGEYFYFVHSYYTSPSRDEFIIAVTNHGITFPSVIGGGNLVATQFHPEKSGKAGLRVLSNFCKWARDAS